MTVKEFMKANGITSQVKLGELIGVNQVTVSRAAAGGYVSEKMKKRFAAVGIAVKSEPRKKRTFDMPKLYAIYNNDMIEAVGTLEELEEGYGIKRSHVAAISAPSHLKKIESKPSRRYAIRLDYSKDEMDELFWD